MSRARLAWSGAAAVLAVVVAVQTVMSSTGPSTSVAGADQPTVTAGVARHGDGTGLTWV